MSTDDGIKVDYALFGSSGNVGRHCLQHLKRLDSDASCVCFSRCHGRGPSEEGTISGYADMTNPRSIEDALRKYHPKVIFIAMPQSLSSEDMRICATAICEAVAKIPDQTVTVVRLSSYAIEPTTHNPQGQGALGNAHLFAEQCLLAAGIRLVSVRPTSFFTNFDNYDLPALSGLEASYNIMSPLGHGSRVNWVACEDIGNVAANCMVKCKKGEMLYGDTDADSGAYHHIVNVTGGAANTLSLQEYSVVLTTALQKNITVTYTDLPLPDLEDFCDLWKFLRNGGFDICTTSVKDYTGREPVSLLAYVQAALKNVKSTELSV